MSATGAELCAAVHRPRFPLSAVRLVPSAVACCGFNGVRKKKRMRRTTKAPVGAKAARSGKKWSPGLCMARREFLFYRCCRPHGTPCRELILRLLCGTFIRGGGTRWIALLQFSSPPQIRPMAKILGGDKQIAGRVHQAGRFRACLLFRGVRAFRLCCL